MKEGMARGVGVVRSLFWRATRFGGQLEEMGDDFCSEW